MRTHADAAKVNALMRELGKRSKGPGTVYIVGGGSAVLIGWRAMTVDVDLKLDPEPAGAFDAIRQLKDELDTNVELAAPDQFIPPAPGWRERSRFIARHGQVEFFHYDFFAQALAKIERSHERDLADVDAMARAGLIDPERLEEIFRQIQPELLRYPGVDPTAFRAKVDDALARMRATAGSPAG